MKKKQKTTFPFLLLGTTLLLLGAATYVYINTRLGEEDIVFDLYDEDSDIYY